MYLQEAKKIISVYMYIIYSLKQTTIGHLTKSTQDIFCGPDVQEHL